MAKTIRMMAVAAGLLAAFSSAPGAAAQDQAAMKAKLAAKLKEPFLAKASWFTDYDLAKKESAKTGKPIFAYFTRSYSY